MYSRQCDQNMKKIVSIFWYSCQDYKQIILGAGSKQLILNKIIQLFRTSA